MRGDSLRDLYAKTLALFGLGLLAGVGALVDYWPVGVGVPRVSAVSLALPEALGSRAVTDLPVVAVVPAVAEVRVSAAPEAVALVAEAQSPQPFGTPIAIEPVALPPVVVTTVAEFAAGPAIVPQRAVVPPLVAGPDFDPELVFQMASDETDAGFISGAMDVMRSTGSTIARGGAITGSSIVGAFRAVSGAFKKLKFF